MVHIATSVETIIGRKEIDLTQRHAKKNHKIFLFAFIIHGLLFILLLLLFWELKSSSPKPSGPSTPESPITEGTTPKQPTPDPTGEPHTPDSSTPTGTKDPKTEPYTPTTEPSKPTKPTIEPSQPTSEPTKSTSEPSTPTQEPTKPTSGPTKPTQEPTKPTEKPPFDTMNCTTLYSCQDCKTTKICRPRRMNNKTIILEILSTIKCPPERPYCQPKSGSCVEDPPEDCGDRNDPFVCLSNGHFPDVDCTKFHICQKFESMGFQCRDNTSYDPDTKVCDPNTECESFRCENATEKKVPHPKTGRYFAYCNDSDASKLLIDACPGQYKLNRTSQTCEPHCKVNGIIPDIDDCHFYHRCTQIIERSSPVLLWERVRLMCPKSQAYSKDDYLCLDENLVDCSKAPE